MRRNGIPKHGLSGVGILSRGYDPLGEVKGAAAERWVRAVNADGRHGKWAYAIAKGVAAVSPLLDAAVADKVHTQR